MKKLHEPVLLSEVLAGLQPRFGETYLDLTAGYAGHASEILAATQNYKGAVLVDRDQMAIDYLGWLFLDKDGPEIIKSDFYNAMQQLYQCGKTFDIILADLGVSSPQLDVAERGFAFSLNGPLDMRMDRTQDLTAAQIVNQWKKEDLVDIFIDYGELSLSEAERVASMIISRRPWQGTKELADEIANLRKGYQKNHPATRVFQALRIAVNGELGILEKALPMIPQLLNPGGRVAIITFHSLEDRLVKKFFKEQSTMGRESTMKIINKSPITAENVELGINPRARSAKLRLAQRN